MSRLFRSNSSVSSRSTTLPSIPNQGLVINEEELEIQNDKLDLSWNIPKLSIKEIYKTTFLQSAFNVNLHVKTLEQVYALEKPRETCHLFDANTIKRHLKTGHNFIHLGLIQVGIKPLTPQGKNTYVLLCLRDARFLDYNNSLMGMVETGLHKRPIHFN